MRPDLRTPYPVRAPSLSWWTAPFSCQERGGETRCTEKEANRPAFAPRTEHRPRQRRIAMTVHDIDRRPLGQQHFDDRGSLRLSSKMQRSPTVGIGSPRGSRPQPAAPSGHPRPRRQPHSAPRSDPTDPDPPCRPSSPGLTKQTGAPAGRQPVPGVDCGARSAGRSVGREAQPDCSGDRRQGAHVSFAKTSRIPADRETRWTSSGYCRHGRLAAGRGGRLLAHPGSWHRLACSLTVAPKRAASGQYGTQTGHSVAMPTMVCTAPSPVLGHRTGRC